MKKSCKLNLKFHDFTNFTNFTILQSRLAKTTTLDLISQELHLNVVVNVQVSPGVVVVEEVAVQDRLLRQNVLNIELQMKC